jgi:hypothetical protein
MNFRFVRCFAVSAVAAVLLSTVACSSNPSAQDTANEFVSTYCQTLIPCCNNGQLTCTSGLTEAQCEQTLATTVSGTEACTSDQVNTCLSDIKNESCSALNPQAAQFPSSCNGC